MHAIVSAVRIVRIFQLMLSLKPLIQGVAAIHRAMLVMNLASPALNVFQGGRMMIHVAFRLFIE